MRKIILMLLIGATATAELNAQTVTNYQEYTQRVVENNAALKGLEYTIESQKSGNRIGITPSDPSVTVNPMSNGNTEITTTVDFLFPTIYFQMKKAARYTTEKNQYEYYVAQFAKLQEIDQAYIDYVYAEKRVNLLSQVVDANKRIIKSLKTSLDNGNLSIIELNSAEMVLLKSEAALKRSESEMKNTNNRIVALNGGKEIVLKGVKYPRFDIGDTESYVERAYLRSYDVKRAEADSLVASQNIKVNKHSWAPNIVAGYKQVVNSSSSSAGGVVVGISIPLWANVHKVATAKMQYSAAVEHNRNSKLNVYAELENLRNSYIMELSNYDLCTDMLDRQSTIELLTKAMEMGDLAIVDYYTEVNTLIEMRLTQLEYQYNAKSTESKMQSLLY